jgi:hypothetical protein
LVVTQKVAAQALPVVGALGGAAVNYAFIEMAATRHGSSWILLDEVHEVEDEGFESVRRGVMRCSGWFGPKPSGNRSTLVGPERASCRLLQIIMDEGKVGADVDRGDDLQNR